MFGFLSGVPSRVRHLLSGFKRYFTRPQYENFCRIVLGLIVAGEKEHDVKSINELFVDRKDQSSVNRFFTRPKWNVEQVVSEGKALLLSENETSRLREYKIIDDTVCRKYGPGAEMVCYNHSSTMGTVLSHDYVTSLYVNGGVSVPDGLKLYGNKKNCKEKEIEFKTKVQLACEVIDEHTPSAKRTIWLWDSWYTVYDVVARCRAHGYDWIGEIKSNRVAFFDGKKYHLNELLDRLRSEGKFFDVFIDGEIYQACKVDVFTKKLGKVSIVVDVKADTDDVHILCTDMKSTTEKIVEHALERHHIEDFHKGAKFLGLGEYRFRESEAALTHAHLVSLAYTLLDVLRRRLLRYGIVRGLPSLEWTVEWVRRKAMHLFIHAVRDATKPIGRLLRMIDTR
jgi:DDE superfamily endonuclease